LVDDPDKIKRKGDLPYPGYMLGCYIQAANGIEIGKNVRIGPSVKLISANHDIYDYDKFIKTNPIILNDNCWLASNVTILPGVEIGEHTIVAAGAVVTKSFKQGNCILAGVPAKVVKTISPYKENKAL
jgi:acetyltransferase-like isoleucine patch superfamily enzyme